MKILIHKILLAAALPAVAIYTSGCVVTNHVWRERPCHPAQETHIRLAASEQKRDVLVQYDENIENSKTIHHRAYWLLAYAEAVSKTPAAPPGFQFLMPVINTNIVFSTNISLVSQIFMNQKVATGGWCVLETPKPYTVTLPTFPADIFKFLKTRSPYDRSFTLWRDGVLIGTFINRPAAPHKPESGKPISGYRVQESQDKHAFMLWQNGGLIGTFSTGPSRFLNPPRPVFVEAKVYTNLSAVPLIASAENLSANGFCAMENNENHSFTLWRNGVLLGTYYLPVYSSRPPATTGRIALSVVTVTADTVIDVAILAIFLGSSVPII